MGEIMKTWKIAFSLMTSALLLGWHGNAAKAEDAPKGNKGYTTPKTVTINLGPELEAMAGWQLRLRMLKIEPGGHIGIHNHKDRPSVVYFVQGTDKVTNEDGTSRTFHAGESTAEGVKTVHWHVNTGNDDVIIFTADVIKAPK
jgi:quercetin dioxygenase-like cupin family protein